MAMTRHATTYLEASLLARHLRRLYPEWTVTIERPLFKGDRYLVVVS